MVKLSTEFVIFIWIWWSPWARFSSVKLLSNAYSRLVEIDAFTSCHSWSSSLYCAEVMVLMVMERLYFWL